MLKYISLFTLISGSLLGCRNNVTHELIEGISAECPRKSNKCVVSLKTAVHFEWDRLYFFNSWTTADSVRNTIKFDYHGSDVKDDYKRMVFVQNNKVVYEEDYKFFDYNSSTVDFPDLPDSLLQTTKPYLTPNKSTFTVKSYKKDPVCKECFDYRLFLIR